MEITGFLAAYDESSSKLSSVRLAVASIQAGQQKV